MDQEDKYILTNPITTYERGFRLPFFNRMMFSLFFRIKQLEPDQVMDQMTELLDEKNCPKDDSLTGKKLENYLQDFIKRMSMKFERVKLKQPVEVAICVDSANQPLKNSDEAPSRYDYVLNSVICICQVYGKLEPNANFLIITTKTNQGVSVMRNTVLFKGRGKWMRWCDDDDASCPMQDLIDYNIHSLEQRNVPFQEQLFLGMSLLDKNDPHRREQHCYKVSFQNSVAFIFQRRKLLEKNSILCPYIAPEDKVWRLLNMMSFPEVSYVFNGDDNHFFTLNALKEFTERMKEQQPLVSCHPIYYVQGSTRSTVSLVNNRIFFFLQIFQYLIKNSGLQKINLLKEYRKSAINVSTDDLIGVTIMSNKSMVQFVFYDMLTDESKSFIVNQFYILSTRNTVSMRFYLYCYRQLLHSKDCPEDKKKQLSEDITKLEKLIIEQEFLELRSQYIYQELDEFRSTYQDDDLRRFGISIKINGVDIIDLPATHRNIDLLAEEVQKRKKAIHEILRKYVKMFSRKLFMEIVDKVKFKYTYSDEIFLPTNDYNKLICEVYGVQANQIKYKNDSYVVEFGSMYLQKGSFTKPKPFYIKVAESGDVDKANKLKDEFNESLHEKPIIQFYSKLIEANPSGRSFRGK